MTEPTTATVAGLFGGPRSLTPTLTRSGPTFLEVATAGDLLDVMADTVELPARPTATDELCELCGTAGGGVVLNHNTAPVHVSCHAVAHRIAARSLLESALRYAASVGAVHGLTDKPTTDTPAGSPRGAQVPTTEGPRCP